ncbi:MAG: hypothetical protein H6R22_875, partial [Chromatiaceae bacterium]|nr:hypothetical protein [Chromatiaceae bacterium]
GQATEASADEHGIGLVHRAEQTGGRGRDNGGAR